jgi:hypothetical protein
MGEPSLLGPTEDGIPCCGVHEFEEAQEGAVDLVIIDDEAVIRSTILRFLEAKFSDRVASVLLCDGLKRLEGHRDFCEQAPIWITDFQLKGGSIDANNFVEMMGLSERKVLFIASGDIRLLPDEGGEDGLRTEFILKPFDKGILIAAIDRALKYVTGEEEFECAPIEIEEDEVVSDVFDFREKRFGNFSDLATALPISFKTIKIDADFFKHVAELMHPAIAFLKESLDRYSFRAFHSLWFESFPSDKRLAFQEILNFLPGANFVLGIMIHDVNAELSRQSFAPDQTGWEDRKSRVHELLDRSSRPFDSYVSSGSEHAFWEKQMVSRSALRAVHPYKGIELDNFPTWEIDLPAGCLESIFETFFSNFSKVRRLAKLAEANIRMEFVREGDEGVIRVYDDLPSFPIRQVLNLFDDDLKSATGGMGTGLARVARLAELDNEEGRHGSITSYHVLWDENKLKDRRFQKSRGEAPREVESSELSFDMGDSRKCFELRLPIIV